MLACIPKIRLNTSYPVGSYDTISSFHKTERGSCKSAVIIVTKGSASYGLDIDVNMQVCLCRSVYLYASTMQFISVVSRYARMVICAFDEDCQRTRYFRRKREERCSVYVTDNIL